MIFHSHSELVNFFRACANFRLKGKFDFSKEALTYADKVHEIALWVVNNTTLKLDRNFYRGKNFCRVCCGSVVISSSPFEVEDITDKEKFDALKAAVIKIIDIYLSNHDDDNFYKEVPDSFKDLNF